MHILEARCAPFSQAPYELLEVQLGGTSMVNHVLIRLCSVTSPGTLLWGRREDHGDPKAPF